MKAIRLHQFGDPDQLRYEDVPDPEPLLGQVRVRLHAVGVNPVETYIRSGNYARKPSLPAILGTDAAGVIDAVGEGVARVTPGTRVYVAGSLATRFSGAYAELATCDAEHVHPLPDRASFAQGAAIGVPYATAYRALFQKAKLEPGETVLIHGASGGVGLACVQFARAIGARIIGTAGSERGRAAVAEHGADHVFDHTKAGYLDEILSVTSGRGVDVIVEMLANVNLERDFTVLAMYGRVAIVGNRGSLEFTPRNVMGKEATVIGVLLWATPPAEIATIHAAIVAGLDVGTLTPVVGAEIPLAEAARAHREVLAPGALGKIVLVP